MRKLLYLLVVVIVFGGCNKSDHNYELLTPANRVFFESEDAAFSQLQAVLTHFNSKETLQKIDKIEYHDSKDATVALVFYHSNLGVSNVLIEKKYTVTSTGTYKEQIVTSMKCSNSCGANPCRTEGHFQNNVLIYAECTCSDCKMEITVGPAPTPTVTP